MQTPLELEILKSEKLRANLLAGFFGFFSIVWTLFVIIYPEHYHSIFGDNTLLFIIPSIIVSTTFYFLSLRVLLQRYINHRKNFPTFVLYFNVFIEVSLPTIAMAVMSFYLVLAETLLMPPAIIYFIFIILSSLTLNVRICIFAGLVAAIEYLAMSYYTFNYTDTSSLTPLLGEWYGFFLRSAILLASGIVTGFITSQIKKQLFRSFAIEKERERVERIFGRHVSPEVASKLLSHSSESSEYKPICVMFLDIRNFTHYAEQHKPATVVDYLNHLFEFMVEIVHDNKGIINKFLGDGFMAVFGAPITTENDVVHAIKAGYEIIKRTEEEAKKGNIPETHVGISLHFGPALTGNVGTKRRQEYTIIGDVVNSAAHIEQLNKKYHTTMLISEDARAQLPEAEGELIGDATIKHRDSPIKLYKLA